MRNILFVISGPSGVGKGTIANMIAERNPNVFVSVSMTTRPARQGETDGKDYYFVTRETFEQKIKNGGLLEYSEHFENFYGTPRDKVLEKLHERDVLLEIDVNGGLEVKKQFPETVLIMIVPPRIEDLRERLSGRKTETEEKIRIRLARAAYELSITDRYDYTVLNDDPERCYAEVVSIIEREKNQKGDENR
ncbi:MAG: guanylate kinase [Clostridia bacterium]|mgnify:FL=1|nr:guanylate kinase [Clostridia bacterium]